MIIHLDALADKILAAGIAIECLTRDGIVSPANLQTTAQPIIDSFDDSVVAEDARQFALRELAEPDLVTMRNQAQAAIDANNTYLAIVTPTAAQVAAQVKKLTQENNQIIRALVRLAIKTI